MGVFVHGRYPIQGEGIIMELIKMGMSSFIDVSSGRCFNLKKVNFLKNTSANKWVFLKKNISISPITCALHFISMHLLLLLPMYYLNST